MGRLINFVKIIIGTILAIAIDAMVFCVIAAIPLAALVYLSLISHQAAMIVIFVGILIITIRILLINTLKYI